VPHTVRLATTTCVLLQYPLICSPPEGHYWATLSPTIARLTHIDTDFHFSSQQAFTIHPSRGSSALFLGSVYDLGTGSRLPQRVFRGKSPSDGQSSPGHGLFSSPMAQRQPHVVNRDGGRRYRRPTGNVTLCAASAERHGGVQSRTPIPGSVEPSWHWISQRIGILRGGKTDPCMARGSTQH
jgi:hypothetical protein